MATGTGGDDMARADLIRFECPACGRHVRAPQESAGGWAECASCREVIRVPGAWPTATEETLSLQEIDTFRPSEPDLPTLLPVPAEAPRGRSRGVLLGFLLACVAGLSTAAVTVYLTGRKPAPDPEPEVAAAPAPAPVVPATPVAGEPPDPVIAPAPRPVVPRVEPVPTPVPVPPVVVAPPPAPVAPRNPHQDADVADRPGAKTPGPDPGANDRDLKLLQGRWFPRRVYLPGMADGSETRDGVVTIDGTTFRQQTLDRDGRYGEERATVGRLDAAARRFDLTFADGRVVRVLYLVDEDELRLLRVPAGGAVPPRVRAPRADGEQLDVCSRVGR